MAYSSLQAFIETLEKHNELIRIKTFVDPVLEIAEITDRVSKTPDRNKALLFENTATEFPLLINAMGSERRMCLALGVNKLDDIANEIENLLKKVSSPKKGLMDKLSMLPELNKFASWMPVVSDKKGACQDIVMAEPDLSKLPIMKCWVHDGGRFITLPSVHTKDPNTGIRNIGMYRMQVFDKNLTAMHWHKHKVSAQHFNEYKKLNKRMPVAVALGGDPAYTYSATAPLPANVDEYMLAGFLRKKKVTLVKCITQPDIEVPADADFIIEGYVEPNEELIWEGPFGDHTGYYSLADWYPRFHVTAITYRKNAIYSATIVGIPPQEDAWIGKATERIFLAPIKMTMAPEIADMNMPVEGVFHNLVIASIHKEFAGQAQKVMNVLWGAGQMMFNKILIIADDSKKSGIPLDDYKGLAQYIFKNLDQVRDVYFSRGPLDVLDHSCSKMGFGGKICIDGTRKFPEELFDKAPHANDIESISESKAKEIFPEIISMNANLVNELKIPVLFVSINKTEKLQISKLHQKLAEMNEFSELKMILYVDGLIDTQDIANFLWRFCNNFEPDRDRFYSGANKILGLDGTTKSKKYDNFDRPWPNIIVADDKTILSVDEKWVHLGLGEKIFSPSLRYSTQLFRGDATVLDND